MASPVLLIGAFIIVTVVVMALLMTSGVYRQLFSRFSVTSAISDDSHRLSETESDWIETHEFWELGQVEEVAF